MKITPAHDFNDFEVGKRHGLPVINVLDAEGAVTLLGNEAFLQTIDPALKAKQDKGDLTILSHLHGLSRDRDRGARAAVVEYMKMDGSLEKIEPHTHMVPHGDRSGVAIEPWLTDQWYVDAKTLSQSALAAVRSGKTKFIPENWEKTYFQWLENIQPWCISRQLWWGHQIPAWYGFRRTGDKSPGLAKFVESTEAEAISAARGYYGTNDVRVANEDFEFRLASGFRWGVRCGAIS